jgi:hypothetical protein
MSWADALGHILQRYTGAGGGAASAPDDAKQDYDQLAQHAPPDAVAAGLSQAFRSDKTPPFPDMVAHLFSNSDPNQRAGLLNQLLGSGGQGLLSAVPGLSGLLGGGGAQVTPEQASKLEPSQVRDIANKAQQSNPGIMDEVSTFYSQHPNVVKALGGLALSIAIQHMARRT